MPNYHIKFLPNIVNLIGYFYRLILLPDLIPADSSENSYAQSLDSNKVYSVHLKPFSNTSTYFLGEHPIIPLYILLIKNIFYVDWLKS